VSDQFVLAQDLFRLPHDTRRNEFVPLRIGDSKDCCFTNRRMLVDNGLNFARIDFSPPATTRRAALGSIASARNESQEQWARCPTACKTELSAYYGSGALADEVAPRAGSCSGDHDWRFEAPGRTPRSTAPGRTLGTPIIRQMLIQKHVYVTESLLLISPR
jgi:hypothetical protein